MGVAKVRVRDRIVRRQEILLAAGRVFIKKGFRLATMEDIATAAAVGVGTLYHYFRSKEHLFASLLVESSQILSERLKAAAAKPLPAPLGLLAINRAYVQYISEYPEYFRIQMFFQNEREHGKEFARERKQVERLARRNFELLAQKIREGQEQGFYNADVEPMAAATVLWASYNGILLAANNKALLGIAGLTVEKLLATAAYVHFAGLGGERAMAPSLSAQAHDGETVALPDLQEAVRAAPWISPAMIFAGMRMTFRPEQARGVRETYQYRISGKRGGTWTVKVDDGAIAILQGAADSPSVVFDINDEDFIRLVTGQVEATDLLMRGDLKVTGSLQQAALFRSFFLPAASPAQARG